MANNDMRAVSTGHELELSQLNVHRANNNAPNPDPETPPPTYSTEADPYRLHTRLMSTSALEAIRANTSRKRDGCGPITLGDKAGNARKLQKFYESQNENIERMLKPVSEHVAAAREQQGDEQLRVKIAVHGSFIANLVLAVLQVYGATSSLSLSLFTTMADALFDPLSNVTLILANRAIHRVDHRRYPSGRARLETVGNIVFCCIMTAVSWILIVVSVIQIVEGIQARGDGNPEDKAFHLPSVLAVAVAFCTKLALFIYCWSLRNEYSQVYILWEDHRNDLIINAFGILTSVGGSKIKWWIDPAGAIFISMLITLLWVRTMIGEYKLLVGVTADPETLQWITYIAMTHSPTIKAIDTVRAYHSGPRLICEVDIVVERDEFVEHAHDVAEELQMKLESLPSIERCFVHIDYETSHKPEHFLKKEL